MILMNERVRGRWTSEQREFLQVVADRSGANKSDFIRHIVDWYLSNGHEFPRTGPAAPADGLIRRKEKFVVMDFLATSAQARAIKEAAGGSGEAAWLRQAVEAYRLHGPLAKKG